jgi:hypothetical protein
MTLSSTSLSTSVSLPTAATSLAASFLGHCLGDAVAGLPYDLDRVSELLQDDDVYFVAADQLVSDQHRRGWRALRADLEGLPAYRVAVLEHGCSGFFRNGFEVIFFGEFALGPFEG